MSAIIKSIFLIITILWTSNIFSKENVFFDQNSVERNVNFEKDSIRAKDLINVIGREQFLNGSYSEALDSYFESLSIRERIYGKNNIELAAAYSIIGFTYSNIGNYELSLKYYDLAEKLYLKDISKNIRSILNLYIYVGTVYREKLDYSKALQYFQQALSLYKENDFDDKAVIAKYSYSIAEIYYLTNEYDKAISIINENINNSNIDDKIGFYRLLAFINLINGHLKESQRYFQSTIELIISDSVESSINLADTYLQYSSFLIASNQFSDAEIILQKAFRIIDTTEPSQSLYRTEYFVNKGYYWSYFPVSSGNIKIFQEQKIQNLTKANNYFEQALDALNFPKNYSALNVLDLNNVLSLIESIKVLKLIADNYSEITNIEISSNENIFPESLITAIETYKTVGSLIQQARTELTTDDSKIQLTSLEYSSFYKLIQVASLAYKLTNDNKYIDLAFQNAERVKSSSVYDKISDQMALENSTIPDSLIELENNLNNQITEYSEKLLNEKTQEAPSNNLISEYEKQRFILRERLDSLKRFMESEYSDYYQLKYASSMSSIYDIQKKMKQDQVIVEYVMNETDTLTELYTFIISKENIGLYKQTYPIAFIHDIETMYGFISSDNYLFTTNEDSKKFCESSFELFKNIIAPYSEQIKDKNITIIPDGKLSYIPFDALITNMPDTSETIQFNHLDYVIKKFNINYSNSANLLFRSNSKLSFSNIKVLLFAPQYNKEKFVMGNKEMTLLPLPGVETEVKKISEIVNSKVFLDKDATEENFRKNVENYDILHLAMHAFINDSLPAFSSLAFTQIDTSDTKSDGLLSTADIYNLKLKAKLTVLSACNTGTGSLQKGEGILSLARGFLYAGCPSIIMSLWEVEDESGTQIMSSFYRNLKKGKTKDEALRSAKLEYLESAGIRTAHPHYWLSFVSIGDNSSLYISYDYYFFILLILAFAGIAVDQIIRIKKARKKQAL